MSVFDKITSITHFYDNSSKEKVEEYLKTTPMLMPHPNHDVEFIVPLFNARKHYKKLKRMLWKYGKIR